MRYRGIPSLGESCGADPGVSVGDMSLPITGKMNALAALDRQNGYAALRSSERYGRRMTARCASELKC